MELYLRRRLASGEGIVTLGVTLSRCVCVRRISVGGEGNPMYLVLSRFKLLESTQRVQTSAEDFRVLLSAVYDGNHKL